jgi:hypothetical protein
MIDDTTALDQIAYVMSGESWDPDTIEAVAKIVHQTGRKIDDVDDNDNR